MGFRRNGKIFSESIVIKGVSSQNRKPTHKSHDIPFEQFILPIFFARKNHKEKVYSFTSKIGYFSANNTPEKNY